MILDEDSPLSERHLALFGSIVQCFAKYEALIDELVASFGGGSATSVKLITASFTFLEKRNAVLTLMRHHHVAVQHYDRVLDFLTVPETHANLLYDILHSVWLKSESENVIHPRWLSHGPLEAVRPMHYVGHISGEYRESPDTKASYTIDDLTDVVSILSRNYIEFCAYIDAHSILHHPV